MDPAAVKLLVSLGAFVCFLFVSPCACVVSGGSPILGAVWAQCSPQDVRPCLGPWPSGCRPVAVGPDHGAPVSGQAHWNGGLTLGQAINAVALMGVGFAEELLFRGWLWGELQLRLDRGQASVAQAVAFSLLHTRFDQGWAIPLGLLPGMFVLGLVLGWAAQQRRQPVGRCRGPARWVGGRVVCAAIGTSGPGAFHPCLANGSQLQSRCRSPRLQPHWRAF